MQGGGKIRCSIVVGIDPDGSLDDGSGLCRSVSKGRYENEQAADQKKRPSRDHRLY